MLGFKAVVNILVAVCKAIFGKGNLKESLRDSLVGMEEFQIRLVDRVIESDGGPALSIKQIEAKGRFPLRNEKKTAFVISILDTTVEGESLPVLSILDECRESETAAFQIIVPMGEMSPEYGFAKWVKIGGIMPDFLETAYKGHRKLSVIVRLVDVDCPPRIQLGFRESNSGVLWLQEKSFEHEIMHPGYVEEEENRIIAHCTIIRLGVYAALVDNDFDDGEGASLKKWMHQNIQSYSENQKASVKEKFNEAFKGAYIEHTEGTLSLSALCNKLNEIDVDSYKYEAIEACYDVIAADNKIVDEEISLVRTIAEALDLDYNEIEKIKDKRLVGLDTSIQGEVSVEALLGINDYMSIEEINIYLRKEFQKWNSRLNTLPEGEERDNAQKMLDLIAEARKNRAA